MSAVTMPHYLTLPCINITNYQHMYWHPTDKGIPPTHKTASQSILVTKHASEVGLPKCTTIHQYVQVMVVY